MELVVPLIGLGAMYIISNQNNEKKKKEYQTMRENFTGNTNERLFNHGFKTNLKTPDKNYPVENKELVKKDINYYTGANPNVEMPNYNPKMKEESTQKDVHNFKSLTGNQMDPCELTHNNMVPFFGSKVTQSTKGYEGLLDSYSGAGSQKIEKVSQAPMFAPQKNMNWTNGMPSTTEYIQERMRSNVTSKMNNVKPWEEVQVGPGLNKGFGREGFGGFNAGMEARDKWLPKTVDQLRVKNNPKNSYKGQVLGAHVGRRGPRGEIGNVEKNRPDTYYIQSSDRWLTTTGASGEAPTTRSENILRDVNRINQIKEHFGGGAKEKNGTYQSGAFRKSSRIQLPGNDKHLGVATIKDGWDPTTKDFGKSSHTNLPNSRSVTGYNDARMGNAHGFVKALVAPIMDIIKPTKKENVIGNMRPTGNVNAGVQLKHRIWNPNDTPKTTIKEQTENAKHNNHGHRYYDGAHSTNAHQPTYGQRDTTTCPALGNPSATSATGAKGKIHSDMYKMNQNINKESISKVDRYNVGNHNLFNNTINIGNVKNCPQQPNHHLPNMPKSSSGTSVLGKYQTNNRREVGVNYKRTEADLLKPFHNNPYTHSITSVV